MARPPKDGIDYFSFDVGLLEDKKVRLIKGEFGAMGIVIFINLLCDIYKENGYFLKWDDDTCILMSEGVGCGCTPQNISEVVRGCLRRSLFNERVFDMFGVLTSAGIQRRYVRAIATREEISLIKEFWLLDVNEKKDVPAGIRNKVTFKSVSEEINPDKTQINPDKTQINSKRKVKESKGKNSREGTPPAEPENRHIIPPSLDMVKAYCTETKTTVDADKFFLHYESVGWMVGNSKMQDWQAMIEKWALSERDLPKGKGETQSSYDLNVLDEMITKGSVWD